MIIVSERFKKTLDERTDFRCGGEIELTDGQKLTLTEEDLTLTGTSVTDGAGSDELPLGEAICRTVTVELMNDDGHLDGYDFFGARVKLWLLLTLDDGTEEKLRFGTFTVLEPESWGETVIISACDDMVKTDRSYHTELVFPATLGSMFRDICDQCDIPYSTSAFPNEDFVVNAPPAGEYTFRRVLGGQGLVVGQHQGGPLYPLDDLRHGIGLAGAGDAQQHLFLYAVFNARRQRLDGLGLVPGGLIGRDDLEGLAVHGRPPCTC